MDSMKIKLTTENLPLVFELSEDQKNYQSSSYTTATCMDLFTDEHREELLNLGNVYYVPLPYYKIFDVESNQKGEVCVDTSWHESMDGLMKHIRRNHKPVTSFFLYQIYKIDYKAWELHDIPPQPAHTRIWMRGTWRSEEIFSEILSIKSLDL